VILLLFVFFTGRGDALLSIPPLQVLLVMASGLVAIALGDTLYIKSLSLIDVSRAFPIAQCTFPVLTLFVAVFLLAEPFSWYNAFGGLLVLAGLYLIAVRGRGVAASPASDRTDARGVLFALMAAAAWTAGTVSLKLGITGMDPFVAAAVRIPVAALALTVIMLSRNRTAPWPLRAYSLRHMAMAAFTGILTYGIAAVGYVTAMQLIGAGKTVLITAVAPIFVWPLSILVLRERPTVYALVGLVTCVGGVILVSVG
jgi:drug/metabolite transporter (DMT)-like permease